jgi:uncharacterized protein
MKLRVVVDTNVFVSHFLVPHQNPSKVLGLAREGRFILVTSDPILDELERVLEAKLGFTGGQAEEARRSIQAISEIIKPHHAVDTVKADESDNRILECALSGKAHVIVTGDKKHLLPLKEFRDIPILNPASFVRDFVA